MTGNRIKRIKEICKELFAPVLLYNFAELAFNFLWPYSNLQAKSIGMTTSSILLISGIVSFTNFPASPLLGFVGDKLGYKTTLILLLFLQSTLPVFFTIIPPYHHSIHQKVEITSIDTLTSSKVSINPFKTFSQFSEGVDDCFEYYNLTVTRLICNDKEYDFNHNLYSNDFSNVTNSNCQDGRVVCRYSLQNNASTFDNSTQYCDAYIEGAHENESSYGNYALLFGLYFIGKILWGYTVGPTWTILDAVSSKKCNKVNIEWAWSNVVGSILAPVAPILTGLLITQIKIGDTKTDCLSGQDIDEFDYRFPFYCCSGSLVLMAIITFFLDIDVEPPVRTKLPWRKELAWALNIPAVGFFLLMTMHGIVIGVTEGFYALYIVGELNVSEVWHGNIVSISTVVKILINIISGLIHKHVGSMNLNLAYALLAAMKLILLAMLSPFADDSVPYVLIFLTLFDTAGPICVGLIGYASKIAPDNLRATAIGASNTAVWVVGRGVGSLVSGAINELLGMRNTIRLFGITCFVFHLSYGILYHTFIKYKEIKPTIINEEIQGSSTDKNYCANNDIECRNLKL